MPRLVCILNKEEARSFVHGGIAHKCSSRRHHHYCKKEADALVQAGDLVWLGKHKKVAAFRNVHSWMKTYSYNEYGEVLYCGMQLVAGGGGY
jgi:hypothetical protein